MFRRQMPVNPKLVGALLTGLLFASLVFAFVSHKGLPGRHYDYATAAFEFVPPSLRPGMDVRVKGVRVGQVHDISYDADEARVKMQYRGVDVRRDATVRLRSRSSLGGQKFVEIDPGTKAAGPLGGGVIGKGRTESLIGLDESVEFLDEDARSALAAAVRELGAGAGGHGEDLNDLLAAAPDLLADLNTTGTALTADEARLAVFLAASERLAGRFSGREAQLEALIGQLGRTLAAVGVDEGGPLRETVKRLPGTLAEATPTLTDLQATAAALTGAMQDLGPAAAALGLATPDLRAALRESVPTLRRFPGVNDLAVPAVDSLATAMSDARPLAPALRRAFGLAASPLAVLAPYAADFNLLANGLRDSSGQSDANGNFLRILGIVIGADNYTGALPPDIQGANPAVNRNPYPAPGQAAKDGKG